MCPEPVEGQESGALRRAQFVVDRPHNDVVTSCPCLPDESGAIGLLFDDYEVGWDIGYATKVNRHDEPHHELWPEPLQLFDHLTAERVVGVVLGHSGSIKHGKQPRHQIRCLPAMQLDL